MKCKFCGHDISDTDTKCPGCDKDVETLKNEGNVIYSETTVDSDIMVGEASTLKEKLADAEESVDTPVVETVEEVKPEEATNTTEEKVEPVVIKDKFKKKSGLKGFVIVLVLIILLAAGGFGYMYFIYTNPAKIAKKVYTDLLNNLPTSRGSSVSLDYTNSKLEGYEIKTTNYISNSDIISNITVTGNEVMLNANALKNNDGIYFYESNIYDKYIKLGEDLVTSKDSFKVLNLILHRNDFINIIKNTNFENYISNEELVKEYTTVTYDQKNMGATKVSYTKAKANGIISKFLIAARDNATNLEAMANILNMSSEDAKAEINNIITNINNDNYKISFDIYTDYLTKTYYKLDINVKSNEHNLVINIEFSDNKVKEVKVTYDETYIYITNNMETITMNNNDVNTTYTYKYTNDVLTYPVLEEAVSYDDVSATIDANINNNDAIRRLKDAIDGNVILDADVDLLPAEPIVTPDTTVDPANPILVPDEPSNKTNE